MLQKTAHNGSEDFGFEILIRGRTAVGEKIKSPRYTLILFYFTSNKGIIKRDTEHWIDIDILPYKYKFAQFLLLIRKIEFRN